MEPPVVAPEKRTRKRVAAHDLEHARAHLHQHVGLLGAGRAAKARRLEHRQGGRFHAVLLGAIGLLRRQALDGKAAWRSPGRPTALARHLRGEARGTPRRASRKQRRGAQQGGAQAGKGLASVHVHLRYSSCVRFLRSALEFVSCVHLFCLLRRAAAWAAVGAWVPSGFKARFVGEPVRASGSRRPKTGPRARHMARPQRRLRRRPCRHWRRPVHSL